MTDTLKSICEQCTHLHRPQLDFLPAEAQRHRDIILRDIGELVSAATVESEKTVLILSACLFESILFAFIQGQITYISARRGAPFALNPNQGLKNYISIFKLGLRKSTPYRMWSAITGTWFISIGSCNTHQNFATERRATC
jgi:hypothetical protein